MADQPQAGDLSWKLSSHPVTLVTFLGFRTASLLVYILGLWFTQNFVLVFIITVVLLAVDFYYLKNIAGRRLVGLRWWNEVNPSTGESQWVFESSDPETRQINATDRRFFWLALYAQPALWIVMGVVAIIKLLSFMATPLWLTLVGEFIGLLPISIPSLRAVVIALVLTVTNTLAFSRCDKFSQASNFASTAFNAGGIGGRVATGMLSRLWPF
ncbi:DUF846-domain-containing protein [Microthyrium microscopicum]|uniref:Golgi apparatus membrane protein TVP23 n=1 Tax=Microthyrium microscopicum TaxID=703497 RepID=A0A6A6URN6_9PEZI|nr:DUF846-domain-containing protein [Microthyrium microscopicum]